MTAAEIARTLNARRIGEGRWIARCTAHEDGTPSLSIREGDDGRTLLHCHAGCETADVLRAAGLEWGDLFHESDRKIARQLARVLTDPECQSDPARRAELKLRDYADREGRRVRDEVLLCSKKITNAEKILQLDQENQTGWKLLEESYEGLAELEFLADLLDSRNPRDWLAAKRYLEEINEITAA